MTMHKTIFIISLIGVIVSLFLADIAAAENKIFIKEYTYMASDIDSKVSSRVIALEQVKRSLLEQLGTYLISETEVRNYQMTKDQISTFTAGIVRAEVVEEKWDGRTYYLKAEISIDPKEVARSVDTLRNDARKSKELADSKKSAEAAMREVERLKAELELAKGDANKREEYSNAIKALSAKGWFMRAYAFHESKDFKNAIDAYTKAIELDPNDADAYYNRGIVYADLGSDVQALNDYHKAIELDPSYEGAYVNRGIVHFTHKRYQQALSDFNKVIELNTKHAVGYFKRAGVYWQLGNYPQALNDFNKVIELDPNDAKGYLGRAHVYSGLEIFPQALNDYNKVIELNLIHAEVYYNRGIIHDDLKNYKQALSDYNKAIELDPNYASAYNNRGVVYTKLASYQNALNDFNKVIEIDPVNAQAYNNRGYVYSYLGNASMFIQNLKIAAQLGYAQAQKTLTSAGIKWQ